MICPTCGQDFWALFLTECDQIYRCRKDRDAEDARRPVAERVMAAVPKVDTSGRPYVTRRKGK
jgi:hypothetical protein